MKPKFKEGDRVLITSSAYLNHPSRMRGGKGTILKIHTFINSCVYTVDVDGDPSDWRGSEGYGWTFTENELAATT